MKLSMWMIANQLISLDPVLEISPKAPAILNSARLAYATNCVYIFQEGRYVVCNGEGDLIKIPDMEINRVFELVQSIFDTYEDWTENLQRYLQWMDYQKFMDEACKLFKNPMVLLDANNKMLGMTRRQIFFKVKLLQMIKRIVPPMSNEVITLVKDTSLATTIALQEIIWAGESFMKGSQGISGVIWPLFFTAFYYLIFSGVMTVLLGRLERKLEYFR